MIMTIPFRAKWGAIFCYGNYLSWNGKQQPACSSTRPPVRPFVQVFPKKLPPLFKRNGGGNFGYENDVQEVIFQEIP